MNALAFAMATYLLLAIQEGSRVLVEIRYAPLDYGLRPSFILPLAIFVGMLAPVQTVLWTWLILGLLLDVLTLPGAAAGPGGAGGSDPLSAGIALGPHALAYLLGAVAILRLRTMVYRNSVLAMVLITLPVGLLVLLAFVFLHALRGIPFLTGERTPFTPWQNLTVGLFELFYTMAVAVPLGWLLQRSMPLWNFRDTKGPHAVIRRH